MSDSDDDRPMEVTVKALQGRWSHSVGFMVTVTGDQVKFNTDFECSLKESKGRVFLVEPTGTRWVAKMNDATFVHWKSEDGQKCSWAFDDAEEHVELDVGDVRPGKRRRKEVDYKKLEMELMREEERQGGVDARYVPEGEDDSDSDASVGEESPRKGGQAQHKIAVDQMLGLKQAEKSFILWIKSTCDPASEAKMEAEGQLGYHAPIKMSQEAQKAFFKKMSGVGAVVKFLANDVISMSVTKDVRLAVLAKMGRGPPPPTEQKSAAAAPVSGSPQDDVLASVAAAPISSNADVLKAAEELQVAETTRAIALLKGLSSYVTDISILTETKIGLAVNNSKKGASDPIVRKLATDVVASWKTIFKQATSAQTA